MATSTLTKDEQFVAFRLAGETYGVPIMLVHEIVRSCEITRIPRSLPHVRGVVNLRGSIVPVIDLRLRLGLPASEEGPESRIVVVAVETGIVGMIVDGVNQVIRIPADQIEAPAELIADVERDLVTGVGKLDGSLVILLDVPKTLQLQD